MCFPRCMKIGRGGTPGKIKCSTPIPSKSCAQLRVAILRRAPVIGSSALTLTCVPRDFVDITPLDVIVEFNISAIIADASRNLVVTTSTWTGDALSSAFLNPDAFLRLWRPSGESVAHEGAGSSGAAPARDANGPKTLDETMFTKSKDGDNKVREYIRHTCNHWVRAGWKLLDADDCVMDGGVGPDGRRRHDPKLLEPKFTLITAVDAVVAHMRREHTKSVGLQYGVDVLADLEPASKFPRRWVEIAKQAVVSQPVRATPVRTVTVG